MAPKHEEPNDAVMRHEFAARLRQAIDRFVGEGSREPLVQRLGTNAPQVSRWYTGAEMPGGLYLMRLVRVLRVDAHWLLTGEGTITKRPVSEDQARMELIKLLVDREIRLPTVDGIRRRLERARALQRLSEEQLHALENDAADEERADSG